ncbi:MAG: hypothetical protein WAL78_04705, partial [Candidatus Acidiferrales bacterium]
MPELPPDDPIKSRSFANAILIAIFVLLLSVSWAMYQEFIGLRPWRGYQRDFASSYSLYLQKQIRARDAAEKAASSSPDYQKLQDSLK